MPGMVDAISAARLRLERAESLFEKRIELGVGSTGRVLPADEDAAREGVLAAIRCLEEAINGLARALGEEPADGASRT